MALRSSEYVSGSHTHDDGHRDEQRSVAGHDDESGAERDGDRLGNGDEHVDRGVGTTLEFARGEALDEADESDLQPGNRRTEQNESGEHCGEEWRYFNEGARGGMLIKAGVTEGPH